MPCVAVRRVLTQIHFIIRTKAHNKNILNAYIKSKILFKGVVSPVNYLQAAQAAIIVIKCVVKYLTSLKWMVCVQVSRENTKRPCESWEFFVVEK